MAVFAAAGFLRPQSWGDALDHLQHAAELGFAMAGDQLRLLAREADPSARAWALLRAAVDVDGWIGPHGRRTVICEDPKIRTVQGFAGPEVCAWLIRRAQPALTRARIYGQDDAKARVNPERTNRETAFNLVGLDVVMLMLRARMGAVMSLPPQAMEPMTVLNYAPGEEFLRHFDFLDPDAPGFSEEIAGSGQRIATFLLYLNDDFEGGETEFPLLGIRHRGQLGDALYFANIDADRAPHRKTLHAGLPPTRGEKWLMSQWVRDLMPRVFIRGNQV
jgi:hypothetical protein